MKAIILSIPDYSGRVAPLFDVASKFLVINSESPEKRAYLEMTAYSGIEKIEKLKDTGVNVVICSAINEIYAIALHGKGIDLVPGVIGDVLEVAEAFFCRKLVVEKFAMPGCAWRRRYRGRRCPYFRELNMNENNKWRNTK